MRGFFKLITIGNEVRYGMEFSLEDVQQLCAAAFPLHTSSAGSNASFSARPAPPFSACTRAENASGATPSRSKRPRFKEEEDAKLVDLKERRGWSWEDIQRAFPRRSTGSLQVRYSTKLKERNTAS
jgi:Myb-like DNA-binding domain